MPALTFPMQFAARTPALSSCTWTAQDIDTLYEGLMFRSLQQLFNAHSSVELRCDVNDWIFGDPLLGPKGKPRAFSFEATCRWLGLDPVEVRVWGRATVITIAYYVFGTAFVLLPKIPALLAERTGPKKGAKKWDTLIMSLVGTIILGIYIVGGLDARNGWTRDFPAWAQIIGVILTLLGYTLALWAIAANAFFSLIVRIQKERGHTVATGGPYRFVRHPGYVGTLLAYIGTPTMLGSNWAILLGVITAALIIIRTALEDKTLLAELGSR